MKYAILFAAFTALLASAIRADENIAVEGNAEDLVQEALAKDILEDLTFKDRPCCDRKPECFSPCRCKHGQILIGRLVEENGTSRQEWKCVDAEPNCKVRCQSWNGFAGFCLSNKQEARPKCHLPNELFNALPSVLRFNGANKAATTQEQLFDLFSRFYLTFGPNGFAYLEESRPIDSCGQCCEGRATCLRRIEFEPSNIYDLDGTN